MKNDNEAQFKRMTEARVEPLVLKLAAPTIVSMLITAVYNMADTYFVGKINTSATAAIGVVFSLMALIQAVGFFFGHGSGSFISRKLGMRDSAHATEMAAFGFVGSLIGGLVITILGLIFMEPLARLLGATDTIMPYAVDYMSYILIGAPWMTASLTLNNQLRFEGYALFGMIGITIGGLLNIGLDPLFIFVFNMGTGGAALATIISQFVSFIILFMMNDRKGMPIRPKSFKPSFGYLRAVTNGGLPSLARQGCSSIGVMVLNNVAGLYGDAAIAAISVVTRVMQFAGSAMIGFGQGFQPVCGFNYGAGLYARVKRAFSFCVKSSFLVLVAIAAVGSIFAPQIIELFRRGDPDVIRIGAAALRFQCISFPLIGFLTLTNMMAQSIGKAARATVLALSRQFLFLIPALYILTPLFGLTGLELSQTVADVFTFGISIPIAISIFKEMNGTDM